MATSQWSYHSVPVPAGNPSLAQNIYNEGLLVIARKQNNVISPVYAIHISFFAIRSLLWAVFVANLTG